METYNAGKTEVTADNIQDDFSEFHVSDDWQIKEYYDKNLELPKIDKVELKDENILEITSKIDEVQNLVELVNDNQDELKEKIMKELKKISAMQNRILTILENMSEFMQLTKV